MAGGSKKDNAAKKADGSAKTQNFGTSAARVLKAIWNSEIFKLPFAILAITAVAAFLLGIINAQTAPVIAQNEKAQINDALLAAVDGAAAPFEEKSEGLFIARDVSGKELGYCVHVYTGGFDPSPIEMVVSIGTDGVVKRALIVSMSETPGLGTKANDEDFLSQFTGKSGVSEIKVDAISGATVTSKAVARGVQMALAAVAEYENGR